ncbi:hypothetical protein N7G274_009580 [Stereocaulon virgatum]|uniref:RING-type domain-containing protein n=1 Tax=Stereocaulon virgatum TaxID=373712 RepID=A0ABR3ZY13_9LECA
MDRPSAASESALDHRTKDLARRIHSSCSLPTGEELDSKQCHICTQPFLTTRRPEIPIKLNCGHIFGMACLLRWLNPLAGNGSNSCPLCRRPVLVEPEPDHEAIRRSILSRFDATVPRTSACGQVDMDDTIVEWMKGAQDRYEKLIGNLVTVLTDDIQDPELWIRLFPVVLEAINTLTWDCFVLGACPIESCYERFADCTAAARPTLAKSIFAPLLRYVVNFEHFSADNLHWLLGRFHAEGGYTADRIVGYYRRIREAHAVISYRLHAALEPRNVEGTNI